MAYNNRFNPDALPAFAEPERKNSYSSSSQLPTRTSSQQNSYNDPRLRHSEAPRIRPADARHRPQSENDYGSSYNVGPSRDHQQQQQQQQSQQKQRSQQQYSSHDPPARIQQQQQQFPPQSAQYRTPPQQAPGASAEIADSGLLNLFQTVDTNGSGHLTEKELSNALVNGDFTKFDPITVRMMIRMFDSDENGAINFDEFSGLWSFLAAWRTLFDRFDEDRSGGISLEEYNNALVAFGYRLSPEFIHLLFHTYDKYGKRQISYDLFVQSCIQLKRMTDVFKIYDTDRDGVIEMKFEEFLTEILRQVS